MKKLVILVAVVIGLPIFSIAQISDRFVLTQKDVTVRQNGNFDELMIEECFFTEEIGLLSLKFNFLTREKTAQTAYDFRVVQTFSAADEIIGGETYHVITPPRTPFYAVADDVYVRIGETVTLMAEDIGEEAIYNWYNEDGDLLFQGQEFQIDVTGEGTYKLEVIAESDGYKDYTTAKVNIISGWIETVYPNPTTGQLTVVYETYNVSDAYIMVSDYMGMVYGMFPLSATGQEIVFNTDHYPIGTYVVTLVCDGVIADTKTFVKH
jgi:hypothetical protein